MYFQDTTGFIVPDKIGRQRLNVLKTKFVEHGGKLVESLSRVRNNLVIIDETLDDRAVADLATKTTFVKCSWISDCVKQCKRVSMDAYVTKHPAKDCRPQSTASTESADVVDLAGSDDEAPKGAKRPRRQFVCETSSRRVEGTKVEDVKPSSSNAADSPPPPTPTKTRSQSVREQNASIISQLKILANAYQSTNDKWRALTYEKAIKQIERVDAPITDRKQVLALPGIGRALADKICEIMATGTLRKATAMAGDERVQALQIFTNVWGCGPTTARQWYDAGHRTLDDVRASVTLTRQQEIGLKYVDELDKRMPRAEATRIVAKVIAATRALLPGAVCTACGSYRRGAQTCGDVDILITHADGVSHEHILPKLVDALEADGLLTDHLVQSAHDGNHQKYMGVCQLPPTDGVPSLHRRLDIIAIPYDEYAPALIYFTGSAHFTRSIYARAKSMGMRLNQHGLRKNIVRAGGAAVNAGQSIDTPTEQSIFEALKLEWRTPEERDHV